MERAYTVYLNPEEVVAMIRAYMTKESIEVGVDVDIIDFETQPDQRLRVTYSKAPRHYTNTDDRRP